MPYVEYPGTPGILLEEIINPPCPYFEGTFEPHFSGAFLANHRSKDLHVGVHGDAE